MADERGRWLGEYACASLGVAEPLFEALVAEPDNLELLTAFFNGGPNAPQALVVYTGRLANDEDELEPPTEEPSAVSLKSQVSHVSEAVNSEAAAAAEADEAPAIAEVRPAACLAPVAFSRR